MMRLVTILAAVAFGGLLAYFFDPDGGRGRRAKARDRAEAFFRRRADRLERRGRYAASRAEGLAHQVENAVLPEYEPEPNDATLAQRVESQIMRGLDVPKGSISINAEDGVVVLRGELDRPEQIRELEESAARVQGVRGVRNLLRLRNAPAPNFPTA